MSNTYKPKPKYNFYNPNPKPNKIGKGIPTLYPEHKILYSNEIETYKEDAGPKKRIFREEERKKISELNAKEYLLSDYWLYIEAMMFWKNDYHCQICKQKRDPLYVMQLEPWQHKGRENGKWLRVMCNRCLRKYLRKIGVKEKSPKN